MSSLQERLLEKIGKARLGARTFLESLLDQAWGWRYTATHIPEDSPAATLYGTWSGILGAKLLGATQEWGDEFRRWAVGRLCVHRRSDGSFLAKGLESVRTTKSFEYLVLHCTNYALGAALELDPNFDFGSSYMDRFLDGDFLARWLEGRSLSRPWEEGNNFVNVASYLALAAEQGVSGATDRLEQLLEWHRKNQNPITGGFDCFNRPSLRQRLESMAGAVHNFHLYLHMGEPLRYGGVIADSLAGYLYAGSLGACLSLDLVQLAMLTFDYAEKRDTLAGALLYHGANLLRTQQNDGGWLEGEGRGAPTTAAGFCDSRVSSCSYATWFRLCALGMIAVRLLGDSAANWGFRRTLGMGYAGRQWASCGGEVCPQAPGLWADAGGLLLSAAWRLRRAGRLLACKILG